MRVLSSQFAGRTSGIRTAGQVVSPLKMAKLAYSCLGVTVTDLNFVHA
jgi:hypothetical protein